MEPVSWVFGFFCGISLGFLWDFLVFVEPVSLLKKTKSQSRTPAGRFGPLALSQDVSVFFCGFFFGFLVGLQWVCGGFFVGFLWCCWFFS